MHWDLEFEIMGNSLAFSLSNVVRTARSKLLKGTDLAVDFVLERVGIVVEPAGSFWQSHIEAGMSVIGASGQRLGDVDELVDGFISMLPNHRDDYESILVPLDWVDRVEDSSVHLNHD